MSQQPRLSIHHCPVCKVAMLGGKLDEEGRQLDTFTCLQCETVVTTIPSPKRGNPNKARE
jgi:hypothetical protein